MPNTYEVTLEALREAIKEIKEILEYQGIQIKKLEDAVAISDQKYTEIAQATDAIRFDHEAIKERISKIE